MSIQIRSNSRHSTEKCLRYSSAKSLHKERHQQPEVTVTISPSKASSIKSDETLRKSPEVHIIHVSDLKKILKIMIDTFEVQSRISSSPYLCLDLKNMPNLFKSIIERYCHNIRCKEMRLENDIVSDEEEFLNNSDNESEEHWTPRDLLGSQKVSTPRRKWKTKKRGPVSIGKDDVARLVSRIMQRSRNTPRKSFAILSPDELPNLIMKEDITETQSEDTIYVDDIPKLIREAMGEEMSVSINDIFNETANSGDKQSSGYATIINTSLPENNQEIVPQMAQDSILEEVSELQQELKKNMDCILKKRKDVEASCFDLISTTTKPTANPREKKLIHPGPGPCPSQHPPSNSAKRPPKVSTGLFGDGHRRTSKSYMGPTLASTARVTFEDPFLEAIGYSKKFPDKGVNGVSKARATTVTMKRDRHLSPEKMVGSKGKCKPYAPRYRFKECARPWVSPFHNPTRLYCLEEVKKSKGEKKLLEDVRSLKPSPRAIHQKGELGKKAQVTKSEADIEGACERIFEQAGMSHSVERLIRVAERLKTVIVPKAKKPEWDPAPKWSPTEEVVSLANEYGMKIIDKMIKPRKRSKMTKAKM